MLFALAGIEMSLISESIALHTGQKAQKLTMMQGAAPQYTVHSTVFVTWIISWIMVNIGFEMRLRSCLDKIRGTWCCSVRGISR